MKTNEHVFIVTMEKVNDNEYNALRRLGLTFLQETRTELGFELYFNWVLLSFSSFPWELAVVLSSRKKWGDSKIQLCVAWYFSKHGGRIPDYNDFEVVYHWQLAKDSVVSNNIPPNLTLLVFVIEICSEMKCRKVIKTFVFIQVL